MAYTSTKQSDGNYQVSLNGAVVGTGSQAYADGFTSSNPVTPAPATPYVNPNNQGNTNFGTQITPPVTSTSGMREEFNKNSETASQMQTDNAYVTALQNQAKALDTHSKETPQWVTDSQALLSTQRSTNADRLAQTIQYIQNTFSALKVKQADTNKRYEAQLLVNATRGSNAFRYTPQQAEGMINLAEREGNQVLADISSREAQAILQAKQASEDKDFELTSKSIEISKGVAQEREQYFKDMTTIQVNIGKALQDSADKKIMTPREQYKFAQEQASGILVEYEAVTPALKQQWIKTQALGMNINPDLLLRAVNAEIQAKQESDAKIALDTKYKDIQIQLARDDNARGWSSLKETQKQHAQNMDIEYRKLGLAWSKTQKKYVPQGQEDTPSTSNPNVMPAGLKSGETFDLSGAKFNGTNVIK